VARSEDRPPRWELERELVGHNGSITAMRFTPDGRRLVVASGDRTCGQWDIATGQELRELVLKHPDWVSSLDISPDGLQVLTTCDDGHARLWRLADAVELAAARSPGRPFNSVGFSPDGSTAVLAAAEDKRVMLWDLSAAMTGFRVQGSDPEPLNPEPPTLNPFVRPLVDLRQRGGEVRSAC
jgi:WD40 repeat protein